jgi:hypothetical protein
MTATTKAAIFPFAQGVTEFDSNPMHFLNEDLASVPVSGIPEEFRKLSRYLPVIVLVPKSAVHHKTTRKKPGPDKSVTGPINTRDVCLPLDAAKAWLKNPNATDTFEFGGVVFHARWGSRPCLEWRRGDLSCVLSSSCHWERLLRNSKPYDFCIHYTSPV